MRFDACFYEKLLCGVAKPISISLGNVSIDAIEICCCDGSQGGGNSADGGNGGGSGGNKPKPPIIVFPVLPDNPCGCLRHENPADPD